MTNTNNKKMKTIIEIVPPDYLNDSEKELITTRVVELYNTPKEEIEKNEEKFFKRKIEPILDMLSLEDLEKLLKMKENNK